MLKRLLHVTRGDMMFQWKYGFYLIYLILIVIYTGILSILPDSVRKTVCDIMVFSDPAAMGMFFMGAIVLLEKSQRILNTIAVSPVTASEYILGKLISIGLISMIVGMILTLTVGNRHILLTCVGLLTASFLFTLCGLFVGSKIGSLTGYIVATVPFEMVGFVPPIAYCLGWNSDAWWMLLHPGCAELYLISGGGENTLLAVASAVLWIMILFPIVLGSVRKMLSSVGGVKL